MVRVGQGQQRRQALSGDRNGQGRYQEQDLNPDHKRFLIAQEKIECNCVDETKQILEEIFRLAVQRILCRFTPATIMEAFYSGKNGTLLNRR